MKGSKHEPMKYSINELLTFLDLNIRNDNQFIDDVPYENVKQNISDTLASAIVNSFSKIQFDNKIQVEKIFQLLNCFLEKYKIIGYRIT